MLVLIDESGDAGFKLVRGSSSHFVVAMVVFDDFGEAERASAAIAALRTTRHRFSVRALVVDKSVIYSDSLRERKDLFYNYFVQMLLRHDHGALQGARIKIDGSGDRHFKNELNSYLRQQLHAGQVKSIRLTESHRDNLIQLADMVAGAILRSYRDKERKDAKRWRQVLARNGKLGDVWDFR
ncbi:MAG: DUF3800 domain-containing protein [Gammaproteobacteria bacterium HGW-Gammaproteobacteria-4]|nr:MAG: DUF3800 domain-containing protein [Gammaproteobacteria bacterium HGW-Gammaproteobacteria-4]